jgi:HK97 family phage major capsid protein
LRVIRHYFCLVGLSVIRQLTPTPYGEMMSFIKSQQEMKANLIAQVRGIIDTAETEGRGLVAEDLQKIDRIEADIAAVERSLETAQRSEERSAQAVEAAGSFVPASEARSDAEIFRSMARGEVRGHNFEQRATLVPATATVPVSFLDRVYGLARLVGPMLDVSEVITRNSGNDLRIPIYTAFSTASQVSAGSAISESNPTFDSLLLQPAKQAFIVPIANELISDAGFDIEAVIAEQAGNAIGYAVNGTATATLVAAAGSGVTASTATAISADNLIDLAYSLDGAARRMPGVGYMANGSTIGAIRKLKDTAGNYLYQVGVGQPDTFAGFAVYENPALDSIATGKKAVLFGDLKSNKIVTTGLEVAVSSDAYFANDVTGYRFTYRMASGLTHSAHVKYLLQP